MINLKLFLYTLVSFVFLFQAVKFYSFYIEYSDWQYVDWLINYQGGFVRRGFIGEFLFKIYQLTTINLDFLVLLFVVFIILFNSYFLIKSTKYVLKSYINLLIFLSPGFFLYPIMNSGVIGRKDILLIFVMGFLTFFEKKINDRSLFLIVIASIITLSLSHSGFLFYTPYILFLYFLIKFRRKKKFEYLEIFSVLSLIILLLVSITFNQGTSLHVNEICASIKNFVSNHCSSHGQINWLQYDYKRYIHEKSLTQINYFQSFFIYLISFILVYLFLGIKVFKSKFNIDYYYLNKINPLFIFVFLFLATFPTYVLGLDWGRYIFMSYSSSFFILIYSIKEKMFSINYEFKINKIILTTIIIFYSFFWTFPFYNATNFKLVLKKPINSFLKYIN